MTEQRYPAITLWQPWASWIAEGWKTIETRTHPKFAKLVGQRILIHAGQRWDNQALELSRNWMDDYQRAMTREFVSVRGVILASAWVDSHVRLTPEHAERALLECESERYGLLLSDIRKIEPPVKAKGSQGIWFITNHRRTYVIE